MEYVVLNNKVKMPKLGYGVFQIPNDECEACVSKALAAGYRLIDTASAYLNEEAVGEAIKKIGYTPRGIIYYNKIVGAGFGL